jgi:hypothetical protein
MIEGVDTDTSNEIIKLLDPLKSCSDLDRQLIDMIRDSKKLMAVKTYKDSTDSSLSESKDYVDELQIKFC